MPDATAFPHEPYTASQIAVAAATARTKASTHRHRRPVSAASCSPLLYSMTGCDSRGIGYVLAAPNRADHRHPLFAGQCLRTRPVPRHPAGHPDPVEHADDAEHHRAGEQKSRIEPCQRTDDIARRRRRPSAPDERTHPATRPRES